jgi:hypothetical protein
MSEMRDHLHAAQLTYHAAVYPEDLAAKLIPARRSLWPQIIATAVAGGAAAIIVIMLLNQTIVQSLPQRSDIVAAKPSPSVVSLPGVPQMPQTIPLAPRLGDQPLFLPSLPSFPSLGDVINGSSPSNDTANETPTTQESL